MESILQSTKQCFKTGENYNLHRHHIFGGSRRKASEKWGCYIWLRGDWHNLAPYGVHNDSEFDKELKRLCQRKFEEKYGHEKFMEAFGKSYL